MIDARLKDLQKKYGNNYWGDRIIAQLRFAKQMSNVTGGKFDKTITEIISYINENVKEQSVVTKQVAQEAENRLKPLSKQAKKYNMLCVSHAHIDMNWMWGWDETVAVTIDTFRTILDLMDEYPEFKYSQSQASIYKIIEDYAPDMLEEIKTRVKEGRWEVTASHWVEADKNMPSGESLSRHILYTKKYLSNLLDINPDSLNIDYEPDTFGHSIQVPEILLNGGVKYYYHCRGYEGHNIYRWSAPSGKSIIVYREPIWYNGHIDSEVGLHVPEFAEKYNHNSMLKVYGVGDHGGGPTRRDIERIKDMNTWPVYPSLEFATYQDYFSILENISETLPEVKGELNSVFTGCYTSQSRIKMANKKSEVTLNEAEKYSTVSALLNGKKYPNEKLTEAWRNTLFNQFHDILPGSGVTETREHALGLFQETMATANSSRSLALKSIASQINTTKLFTDAENYSESTSEGAGVGFGTNKFQVLQAERGTGLTRAFHVFNSTNNNRRENVEITFWDWHGDVERMVVENDQGHKVQHQFIEKGFNHYWGHHFMKVIIQADVPAFGYSTYVLKQSDEYTHIPDNPFFGQPRTEQIADYTLENEYIKVVFNRDASIQSFIDKESEEEMIDSNEHAGVFRYVEEDTMKQMTSWIVGRYMNVEPLIKNVVIKKLDNDPKSLRQTLCYEVSFKQSTLRVTITLDKGSRQINYHVACDWEEIGRVNQFIPQLNFYLPLSYEPNTFKYDVPMGIVERKPMEQDAPGNSFIFGEKQEGTGRGIMLITESKYGFRGTQQSIATTLLRGSYDPDPYPEIDTHEFSFAVRVTDANSNQQLISEAEVYNYPLQVFSGKNQNGNLSTTGQFIQLESDNMVISSIKLAEDSMEQQQKVIIRFYETEGKSNDASLNFLQDVKNAYFVNINEERLASNKSTGVNGKTVTFETDPYTVATICVEV